MGGDHADAEELAAIVPVPEAVVDDAESTCGAKSRRAGRSGRRGARPSRVLGLGKPASWPAAIVPAATAAGNTVAAGTAPLAEGSIVADIDAALDARRGRRLRRHRHRLQAVAARRCYVARATPTANGSPTSATAPWRASRVVYVGGGVFDATTLAVAGDFDMAVLGLRQDFRFKILDQAVITDDTGQSSTTSPQQDMLAMRVTARYGYATAIPVTQAGSGASLYPFATLESPVVP